jgi:hypothetical protein
MKKPVKISINDDDNTDSNDSIYNEDEFILCKKPNGEITSCGFSVNSAFLREGKSPMMMGLKPFLRGSAKNRDHDHDDENEEEYEDKNGSVWEENMTSAGNSHHHVSDLFKNLSVPAGIFYIQQKNPQYKQANYYEEDDVNDDLFDKLINLASEGEKRKRRNGSGTRKVGIVLVAGAKKTKKKQRIQKDK